MEVARQVYPSQQTEMLPLIFFGAFGYPEYPGVSKTEHATFFVFDDDATRNLPLGKKHMAFMLKMDENSPVREALKASGFTVTDQAGWTFVFEEGDGVYTFASNEDVKLLAEMNNAPMSGDFEGRFYTQSMLRCPHMREAFLTRTVSYQVDEQGNLISNEKGEPIPLKGKVAPNYEAYINALWEELGTSEYLGFEIALGEEAIDSAVVLKAQPGTALDSLLSQEVGGTVPLARFLSADQMLAAVAKYDPQATQAYIDTFFDRVAKASFPPEREGRVRVFQHHIRQLNLMHDGTLVFAENYRDGKATVDFMEVLGGDYDDASLVESLKTIYTDFFNNWAQKFAKKTGTPLITFDFIESAFEVEEVPVHKVTFSVNELDGPPVMLEEQYFAIVRGSFLSTVNPADMATLIQTLQAQEVVSNNMGESFTLRNGELLQFTFNLKESLDSVSRLAFQEFPDNSPEAIALQEATFAALEELELDPITGGVALGSGEAKAFAQVSVHNITELVRLMREMVLSQPQPTQMPPMIDDNFDHGAPSVKETSEWQQ